eukprot:scaffold10399_cov94-Isochrysis_galbana.AAC.7
MSSTPRHPPSPSGGRRSRRVRRVLYAQAPARPHPPGSLPPASPVGWIQVLYKLPSGQARLWPGEGLPAAV